MANYKRTNRRVIQVAPETTPGVEPPSGFIGLPVNTGASTSMQADSVDNDVLSSEYGKFTGTTTNKRWQNTYALNLKGAGVNGDVVNPPEFSSLLEACRMVKSTNAMVIKLTDGATFNVGETLQNTTDGNASIGTVLDQWTEGTGYTMLLVTGDYSPQDSGDSIVGTASNTTGELAQDAQHAITFTPTSVESEMGTVTIRDNYDGIQCVATYVRGEVAFNATVNQFLVANFTLTGIYQSPTDTPLADVELSTESPKVVNGATVNLGTLNMSEVSVNDVQLNMGNSVAPIPDLSKSTGIAAIDIGNADPTGSFTVTKPALANYNPYQLLENDALFPLGISVFDGEGKRIRLVVPNAQLTQIGDSDANGVAQYNLSYAARKDTAGIVPICLVAVY